MSSQSDKPLLFVDVDGVISLFGFSSMAEPPGRCHWINDVAHCIPDEAGARLTLLAEHFDLVWATGWENMANEHLPTILGLPFADLPTLTFDGRAVFGSSHWKLDALTAYAGGRSVAWIDDNIDDACRLWALSRREPTVIVQSRPNVGLTDAHVERLLHWTCSELPTADARQTHAV